jgi:acyl-coenzyme A thioesterase PaaI-like protein
VSGPLIPQQDQLSLAEPRLEPLDGWSQVSPRLAVGPGSFVSGDPDGPRIRLRYYRRDADQHLVGRVWFGPGAFGPPRHAHGGSTAAVLDEAMGLSAWMSGHAVVAARIGIEYRRLVPLGLTVTLDAWIERIDGKKVHARARLLDHEGGVFVAATGLFVALGVARFGRMRDQSTAGSASRSG